MKYSLLITGPVINTKNILKLRDNFDYKFEIILVTWSSFEYNLKNIDFRNIKVIICDDVNTINGYEQDGTMQMFNYNRQKILIEEGLKYCNSDYILRIRSDIYLDINEILTYKHIMDKGLFLTIDISSVNPKLCYSEKLYYHPCDWVFAARKELFFDLINNITKDESCLKSDICYDVENRKHYTICSAEQAFCLGMNKFKIIPNLFDFKNIKIVLPTSPIDTGFYVMDSKSLKLNSNKYRLNFLSPYRITINDNKSYKFFHFSLIYMRDLVVHSIRKFIRKYK